MNPELLRNLWLQFSPERLIAAPIILGAVFALAALATDSWEVVGAVASWGYVLIAYLWGTRRAVNVLADEIAAGTWDGQRMSSIGPWTMAWGKLLGGTVYVWYCALLCLATYAAAEVQSGGAGALAMNLSLDVTGALLVQAIALLLALLLVGKGRRLSRRTVAFAQGGALLVGIVGVTSVLLPSFSAHLGFGIAEKITWFGVVFSSEQFRLLTQALFLGWAIAGIYRLMAAELQLRQWPWVWSLFSLFLIAYYQGFISLGPDRGLTLRLATALCVAVVLFYVAMFAQSNDIVRYRWLLHHNRKGKLGTTLSLFPLWAPSLAIAILIAVRLRMAQSIALMESPELRAALGAEHLSDMRTITTALIFFMMRDVGIVLLLNFARRPKAPDLAAFLYLIVLYGVCGGLALVAGADALLPWFLPGTGPSGLLAMTAPLVELIVVVILLWRRWVAESRALQLRPAA